MHDELDQNQIKSAVKITHIAVLTWLISLALPGFSVESSSEIWFGYLILLTGLMFGWLVNGWAVYANLFFVFAMFRLYTGKMPSISVYAMLVLTALLPLFSGVIRDSGSGYILPVVSWGWGAVFWVISILLLACAAAVRAEVLSKQGLRNVALVIVTVLAIIPYIHHRQLSSANEQERDIYFSRGMAFTIAPLCDVPLVWPTAQVVPSDEVVAFDISPELKSGKNGKPVLSLPTLANFHENGFDWVTFREPMTSSNTVKVRYSAKSSHLILQAKETSEGAIIRLLDEATKMPLYEQRLKTKILPGGRSVFCPGSSEQISGGRTKGYDSAVLYALGQSSGQKINYDPLLAETADLSCNLGADNIDGIDGLRMWDGRHVILYPESIRSRIGFCSDSYISQVYVANFSGANLNDFSLVVQIYDRKTLRPLANYYDGRSCGRECKDADRDIIKRVRISDGAAIVETTLGELVAKRITY